MKKYYQSKHNEVRMYLDLLHKELIQLGRLANHEMYG